MAQRREQITDELLVLSCCSGNREAFQELATRWQEPLWRHALRLTGQEDAAWDVVQETWMNVARGITRLRDPGAFRRWVYTIASRRAQDWHRRQGRSPSELPELPAESPPGEASGVQEDVRLAMARLSGTQRVILALHHLEGFGVAEIAEILGIPTGTVKSRLHHSREKLRNILEGRKKT